MFCQDIRYITRITKGNLIDEIKAINRYNTKLVRYYRSGPTHPDSLYYLRSAPPKINIP